MSRYFNYFFHFLFFAQIFSGYLWILARFGGVGHTFVCDYDTAASSKFPPHYLRTIPPLRREENMPVACF